jgi:hypothetical protein
MQLKEGGKGGVIKLGFDYHPDMSKLMFVNSDRNRDSQ